MPRSHLAIRPIGSSRATALAGLAMALLMGALMMVATLASGPVAAQDLRFASLTSPFAPRHLAGGRNTSAPVGFVRFCSENPQDCLSEGTPASAVILDPRHKIELEQANSAVNASIEPMTDQEHYGETERWAYPADGKGDCEDYVLEKRRLLVSRGWPASVLLITVVRDHHGDGHAVLTVVTDQGDLVLDNQESKILPWRETGYRFVKRQSQESPAEWVSLGDTIGGPTVVGGGQR